MDDDAPNPLEAMAPRKVPKRSLGSKKGKSPVGKARRQAAKKEKPLFPVSDIHLMLARGRSLQTVEPQVPLYLAAVEQYVAHELVELAGNHALSRGSRSIDQQDVLAVIRDDPELFDLLGRQLAEFE